MSLRYNGVEFVYGLTTHHVNGPVKDPSNSDQLLTEIRLRVQSIVTYQQDSGGNHLPPAKDGDVDAQGVLARVRHLLTAPRRAMYYDLTSLPGQTGPAPIIDLPDGRDDAGGPWPDPDAFSATLTTQGTIVVTWACTVKIRDCGADTAENPLSLRWEDAISYDETWKATYRRTGTLVISTRSDNTVDWFRRNKIAPLVLPGFARRSAQYTVSRDGLRCDFVFSDEQIRFAAPYPAVNMSITQSESFPLYYTPLRRGTVSVVLTGVQSANVVELSRWAIYVAAARVWAAKPLANAEKKVIGEGVLQSRETSTGVDVSCQMSYKVTPGPVQENQIAAGNVAVAWAAAGVGAFVAANAPLTQQGRDPTKNPPLPWVGFGTSPPTADNPAGYAKWANPTAAVGGPVPGVGLGESVVLFAALLNDPCGEQLKTTPYATDVVEIRATNPVPAWNTPTGGGQGGTPSTSASQLSATLTAFTAAQTPAVVASVAPTSFYVNDNTPGVYDLWQCENEYPEDPGVVVLPTCNPAGKNIKVAHSSTMVTLRKKWAAQRTGAPPNLPPKTPPSDNWVYTGGVTMPRETRLAADGVSVVYEARGVFEYQCLDKTEVELVAELPPFVSPDLAPTNGWVDLILNATSVLTGGVSSVPSPLGSGTMPGPPLF